MNFEDLLVGKITILGLVSLVFAGGIFLISLDPDNDRLFIVGISLICLSIIGIIILVYVYIKIWWAKHKGESYLM